MGPAAAPQARAFLCDANWLARAGAAEALGAMGPAAAVAVPQLEAAARGDAAWRVRHVAEEALGKLER